MRLAVVIPTLHGAGCERFVAEMLPTLCREFEVELILYERKIDYPIPDRLPVHLLGSPHTAELSTAAKGVRLVSRTTSLARMLRTGRYDVVLGLIDTNNLVVYAAARLVGLPVVLAEHTINENFFRFNPYARRMRHIIRPLLGVAYQRADRVIVISEAMRSYLGSALGVHRPVDVVGYGVDLGKFHPPDGVADGAANGAANSTLDPRFTRARIRVLCVARLDDNKDQAFCIGAFPAIRAAVPEAELFLVGVGPNEAKLREIVAASPAASAIHLLGWQTAIPDYMRAADLFVLTSHHEGSPVTVIESLCTGLPVVVTRSTEALFEVLENGRRGAIVPVGDGTAFSRAAIAALREQASDRSFRDALAAYGQERFDVRTRAADYARILRMAADGVERRAR
jgi:glycosyltransferase involved in cell wall biosynthesis